MGGAFDSPSLRASLCRASVFSLAGPVPDPRPPAGAGRRAPWLVHRRPRLAQRWLPRRRVRGVGTAGLSEGLEAGPARGGSPVGPQPRLHAVVVDRALASGTVLLEQGARRSRMSRGQGRTWSFWGPAVAELS